MIFITAIIISMFVFIAAFSIVCNIIAGEKVILRQTAQTWTLSLLCNGTVVIGSNDLVNVLLLPLWEAE